MSKRMVMVSAMILAVILAASPATAEIEKLHHDLTVQIAPDKRQLTVVDRLSINGGGRVVLRLSQNFVVTGFTIDGRRAPPTRHGTDWPIELGEPGAHELTIEYTGRLGEMLSPEGGYLAPNTGWHPVIDDTDFTFRLDVAVPAPQKAVAPGRLMEEHDGDVSYRAVFQSETPLDGIVLLTGPYDITERRHGEIRLRTYFYPAQASLADGYLTATAGFIDLYQKQIGPYPFSAFHIVAGPLPVGLGFKGLTYISKRALPLPFIRDRSLGHEVLHNWWGNGVRVDYETGNWSEGLTTFMADYAYARLRSATEARQMRLDWLRDFAALPVTSDQALTTFRGRSHDASQVVGYNKAAFIFHMLEKDIGSAAFNQGLRLFWQRHKFNKAGWKDLQQAFEATSKKDLHGFFTQWTRRTGAPKLSVGNVGAGTGRITFSLGQTKIPYDLKVPLSLWTSEGENRFRVHIEGATTAVELTLKGQPKSLTIDPDFDVFRLLDAAETPAILRDTTLNPATMVFLPDGDGDIQETAHQLAGRLLDAPLRLGDMASDPPPAPLLIIGTTAKVGNFLKAHDLPPTPTGLVGKGTARVWAGRRTDGFGQQRPLLVVEAADRPSLHALLRPLPHYRRKSYLVFEGAKATEHGSWPATAGPLHITFD